jgi:hypothetical protein
MAYTRKDKNSPTKRNTTGIYPLRDSAYRLFIFTFVSFIDTINRMIATHQFHGNFLCTPAEFSVHSSKIFCALRQNFLCTPAKFSVHSSFSSCAQELKALSGGNLTQGISRLLSIY